MQSARATVPNPRALHVEAGLPSTHDEDDLMGTSPVRTLHEQLRCSCKQTKPKATSGTRSTVEAYLGMLTTPLLTRDGEIEVAARIEEGEHVMLRALLRAPAARREFVHLAERVRADEVGFGDVLRGADDDADAKAKLLQALDTFAELEAKCEAEEASKGGEQQRRREAIHRKMVALFDDLRWQREQLDVIAAKLEALSKDAAEGGVQVEAAVGVNPVTMGEIVSELGRGRRIAEQAKAELVHANLRLVVHAAKRRHCGVVDLLDRIQEGNIGLMRAVDKYDYRRGYRFSTYASWWIKQSISRAIADQSRTIRVPIHMHEALAKVRRVRQQMRQELGVEPTPEDLALCLDLPIDKVTKCLAVVAEPISLDAPAKTDDDRVLGDFVQDERSDSPQDALIRDRMGQLTREMLDLLTPRERRVVQLRFGIDEKAQHTLEEIGKEFNVTRERIRQIEASALSKLRHPKRAERLRVYFL